MKSMSVAARLSASFAVVVGVFVLVVGGSGWVASRVMEASAEMEREATLLRLAERWVADIRQNSARSLAVAQASGPDMLAFFGDAMKATSASTTETQKSFLALATEEDKPLADKVIESRKAWLAIRDEINRLKQSGDDAGARALVASSFQPATQTYINVAQELADEQAKSVKGRLEEIQRRFQRLFLFASVFTALGVALAVLVAYRMVRSIRLGLRFAIDGAARLGEGDLSQAIDVRKDDEFGHLQAALNEAQAQLRTLVLAVREGSEGIHLASQEVATGSMDLSARTEQAASNLQETAASMEQVSSAVQTTADGAAQAMTLVNKTASDAEAGGRQVADVVSTMQEIQDSSKRIADITGVIDGIAFQTNILALNAAVEAARAGEQGRGFAVVAGEVRALAHRSAEAAREIKSLIGRNVERVERGAHLVEGSGKSMTAIVQGVSQVRSLIEDITSSTAEQSQGVLLINGAIADLDAKTQQNAALVEESAAAAASLQEQSTRLKQQIERFSLG